MGYAIMSARKIMLTNRINTLNFQIMCLSETQTALSNVMNNYQRQMNMFDQFNSNMMSLATMSGVMGMFGGNCNGNKVQDFISHAYQSNFLPMFDKYATVNMIESDVETQKKQLETQLQAATKELEAVEKSEEQAIGRATPKYA